MRQNFDWVTRVLSEKSFFMSTINIKSDKNRKRVKIVVMGDEISVKQFFLFEEFLSDEMLMTSLLFPA